MAIWERLKARNKIKKALEEHYGRKLTREELKNSVIIPPPSTTPPVDIFYEYELDPNKRRRKKRYLRNLRRKKLT